MGHIISIHIDKIKLIFELYFISIAFFETFFAIFDVNASSWQLAI